MQLQDPTKTKKDATETEHELTLYALNNQQLLQKLLQDYNELLKKMLVHNNTQFVSEQHLMQKIWDNKEDDVWDTV